MEEFMANTISSELFQVENVIDDNSCFYRALANAIGFLDKKINEKELITVKLLKYNCSFLDFFKSDKWGYDGDDQEELARKLQEICVEWISKNGEYIAPLHEGGPNILVKDLVEMVHGISYIDYCKYYQIFAGDIVIDDDNNIVNIPNRWGGLLEQFVISEILKLPIIILTPQKFDIRLNKIISGRINNDKPIKGVRFKVSQITGLKFIRNTKPHIFLLWKKSKNGEHYMALYPKNIDIHFLEYLNKVLLS